MSPGLIVGGWFASSIISKLITELVECAKDHQKKLGLKDELAHLQQQLPKIEAVLNKVDPDLIRNENPGLAKWLMHLRDAAEGAEDVMDEMEIHLAKEKVEKEKVEKEKNKVRKAIYIVKSFLEHAVNSDMVLDRLKEAVKAIDLIVGDVDTFYNVLRDVINKQDKMVKSVISNRETGSGLKVRTRVFGRETEKMHIINKLLNPEYKTDGVKFTVLPIIGAGGVGKTTLAQYVYNDDDVKAHFALRMWVYISINFDKELLAKKLYESAFGEKPNFLNLDSIEKKLLEKLESKRFLVVFDDAWNYSNTSGWKYLFALLKSGRSGSMILLTTRVERVVATLTGYNLMDSVFLFGLNKDDLWDLFKECSFGDEDPRKHKQLVEIGREIMDKKLKGSPLAAETVGGILCSDLNAKQWTSVLNNELWSLSEQPNDIMPALRLTYQYLPSHLKPCFSFCSIFPQDHVFIKDDLIYMWIALGLVPRDFNAEENPEDVGSKYFEEMLNRSIFRLANPVHNAHLRYPAYTYHREQSEKQFVEGYIMHDLMHDLSAFVSQDECYRSNIDKLKSVPTTVRHLFIHVGDCREFKLSKPLKNIRTLILQFNDSNNPNQDCINGLLKEMKSLRVLTLFSLTMSEVPTSVSDQLHLRYLSLSSYMLTVFPQSMSRLYLLETLVCGGYGSDGQADVLVMLINMRHLIASEYFVETIANIGKLTSLQELSFWVGRESGFEICQLRDMRELRHLSISNINDVDSHKEAIEAKLRDKHSLRKLSLQWNTNKFNEEVFDKLEPHFGLKELTITNYKGGRPPVWLQAPDFPKLELLTIESMTEIKELSLKQQPKEWMRSLKELTIYNCTKLCVLPPLPVGLKKLKLECLGLDVLPNLWEDKSSKSESLSCLVSMEIYNCSNLLSLAEGLLQNPEQFPALKELTILICEKLKFLPEGFSRFTSLKTLKIHTCGKLCVIPPLPLTLEELTIGSCGNLVSLPEGLVQNSEQFPALKKLTISTCEKLKYVPKGFNLRIKNNGLNCRSLKMSLFENENVSSKSRNPTRTRMAAEQVAACGKGPAACETREALESREALGKEEALGRCLWISNRRSLGKTARDDQLEYVAYTARTEEF